MNCVQSSELAHGMRCESADFIGARSISGCNKAECRAATDPVVAHTKPGAKGTVHVDTVTEFAEVKLAAKYRRRTVEEMLSKSSATH